MKKKLFIVIIILFISSTLLSIIDKSKASERKDSQSINYREPNEIINTPSISAQNQSFIKKGEFEFDLTDLIQILGLFIGIGIIALQIYLQHRSNLKLQLKNFKQETQIKLYNEIAQKINNASENNVNIQTKINGVTTRLNLYLWNVEKWNKDYEISDRALEIIECHNEALKAILELMRIIEQHLIVNPNLSIFITAFNSVHHDLLESFRPISTMLIENLPVDVPKEKQQLRITVFKPDIKKENVEAIEHLSSIYLDNLLTASCYIYDLSCEAQNLLLGEVFENKVPARKPIDSKYIVINTDPNNIKSLERYFKEETAWGKEIKKYENNVKSNKNDN